MARLVRDEYVLERMQEKGFDSVYVDNLPQYRGPVNTLLEKVKLEQAPMGLTVGVTPVKEFNDIYKLLNIKEPVGELVIDTGNGKVVTIEISVEELKVLKTLLLKNISRSEEYSKVVGELWLSLVKQIMQKKDHFEVAYDESWNAMQRVVFDYCIEFIRSKITKEVVIQQVLEDK